MSAAGLGWADGARAALRPVEHPAVGDGRAARWRGALVGQIAQLRAQRGVRRLLLSGLGLVYAVAFVSAWSQLAGLIGSSGIAPSDDLLTALERRGVELVWWRVPTLLWLWRGDAGLDLVCALGVAAAVALACGAAPRLAAASAWLAYLSIVSVGDVFFQYQWDALLLEAGLLAILLAPAGLAPRLAAGRPVSAGALLLFRWLLFRLIFLSGYVKLASGDPTWWSLDALSFHFWTQPLPTWSAWWAHQLPASWLRLATGLTLAIELVLPFLFLGPRAARLAAAAGVVLLQLAIAATGSYGFFNLLTAVLCIALLDDAALRRIAQALRWVAQALRWIAPALRRIAPVLPEHGRAGEEPEAPMPGQVPPRWRVAVAGALATVIAVLGGVELLVRMRVPLPERVHDLRRLHAPLRSINSYGLFASMTTRRQEIALEGSQDGRIWEPYVFRWKPGDPRDRPRFATPHMPRLDWQMWFAALRGCERAGWLHRFMERLLRGEPAVRDLLAAAPFAESPPRVLRTPLADYRFSRLGAEGWWEVKPAGAFCPPVTLRGGRLAPWAPPR